MNAIRSDVEYLVRRELESASKKFGPFNSAHEGYAVILEEAEELEDEVRNISVSIKGLWLCVKSNNKGVNLELDYMEKKAIHAACEAIQLAAMCLKFRQLTEKTK